jgi:hypothetical protein
MSHNVQRKFAATVCYVLQCILPAKLQPWGLAIRNEVAEIQDHGKALRFALESLWGLAPRAAAMHLQDIFARLNSRILLSSGATINMGLLNDIVHRPRQVGIASAISAVMLGLAYMVIAGAPMGYPAINAAALVLGLVILSLLGRITTMVRQQSGATMLVLALALLATALFGDRTVGAARWVDLGVVFIQPSLILLPFMIVGFVHSHNAMATAGLLIAATALAMQPDRAMSGMLLVGLATLTVFRSDRFTVTAFIGSVIGFAATLMQADALPAVPFVDQIFYSSFDVSVIAGLAVLGGSVLLVIPAILGWLYDVDNRQTYCVFGAVWIAAIAAAAIGNYPTPVVGYSGGAVLGYVLSLMTLPKIAYARRGQYGSASQKNTDAQSINQNLHFAAGCAA